MAEVRISGKDTADEDKVQKPLKEHKEYMSETQLARALMGGTDVMRGYSETYLPKEEGEATKQYQDRRDRSYLRPTFERTGIKLAGEVFQKDVELIEETPDDIKDWCKNIDLQGQNINRFARTVFLDGVYYGVTHVLVDYPEVQLRDDTDTPYFHDEEMDEWKPLTEFEIKRRGWRPYWVHVQAKDIIGWRTETVNGQKVLKQLRIKEEVKEPFGQFGVKVINRIRVLEPGRFEIWEEVIEEGKKEKDPEWRFVKEGVTTLDFIPLHTFMPGEQLSTMTAKSALDGLAWMNLEHWQSSSDQRNILHYARIITYFGKMLEVDEDDEDQVVIGANRLIQSDDPNGDLKVVEHSGEAINAGRQDLQDLEMQMSLYGLLYMMPRSGMITATEKSIDASEADSALKAWALAFEDFLNTCLDYTGRLVKKEEGKSGAVQVNTNFRSFLRDEEPRILIEAYRERIIPRELVVEEFKRRDLIASETDMVDLEAMLEKDLSTAAGLAGIRGGFRQAS